MKTIGLIGGTSWESTKEYYRIINQAINRKLGKKHSAKIILYSFDFEDIFSLENDWSLISEKLIAAATILERSGADFILICANTMHKVAEEVQSKVKIPILHIADVTARKIKENGLNKVGLLGTKFTMTDDFYQKRLKHKFDIKTIVPDAGEKEIIRKIIFDEICAGKLLDSSKQKFLDIIENLKNKGAAGIILGCTEIPLLIQQKDVDIPVFDTLEIHVLAAVECALK
ncbi:MAG: aspartate/glutamate racemase family protein [Candidatus Cloacimonetes bacterium]|nr:aspartate/glutamate racemase family protein [Candidatus Cloacimonadota bacterium]